MKKQNKKLMTLMLAGALCSAALGGSLLSNTVTSSAADATYDLTTIFSATKAEIGANDNKVTQFTFEKETKSGNEKQSTYESVSFKRALAYEWRVGAGEEGVRNLSITFAFADANFEAVAFTLESNPAWSTEDNKAINNVRFTVSENKVYAKVVNGKMDFEDEEGNKIEYEAGVEVGEVGQELTLTLKPTEDYGKYSVQIGEVTLDAFTNIGKKSASYSSSSLNPFVITADVKDDATATSVLLYDINGQSFKDIAVTGDTTKSYSVKDNAAPVVVVNEAIDSFLLGTEFEIDYTVVDVLASSSETKKSAKYYQYNPTDEYQTQAADATEKKERTYKTLASKPCFFDMTYTADEKTTSVFKELGAEYVSITVEVEDKTGKYSDALVSLSWYAMPATYAEADGTEKAFTDKQGNVDYIKVDNNTEGATYRHLVANDETKKNDIVDAYKADYEAALVEFEKQLNEEAKDTYAGSNSYVNFPDLYWLISDNNGYSNLRFTISYKKPSSSSAQTSTNVAANNLRLATTEEGWYEFKIFAVDDADNTMQYYVDGEKTAITSTNIWDLDEIPTFRFEIKNQGLKIRDTSDDSEVDRKSTEDIGEKYSFSDITIVGASNLKENYALYKLNDKADALNLAGVLTSITYKSMQEEIEGNENKASRWNEVKDGNYIDFYLTIYAELLAKKVNATVEEVKACFTPIAEFDSSIDKEAHKDAWDKSDNKYNWSVSSQSFTAVEAGEYLIIADYWEAELPQQRVPAYKAVYVESEKDEIEGENTWLKDNLVSVILFSVAGVMLILIIILLLVKPSDETLEDVDAKAEKKEKKDKNEKK